MGLGDELMAAGEAQALSKACGNCKVAILDKSGVKQRWHEMWDNDPHIAKLGDKFTKSIVNGPGRRGYIESFNSDRWLWRRYKPIPPKLFFSDNELRFANSIGEGFVVIEPNLKVKAESVNRNWGWNNFVSLVSMFPNLNWVQIGPDSTKVLPNVKLIKVSSPRMAAASLTKAKAFVSHEGGMHHMAAAVNLRGVVIYGGFTSPMVSGYDVHNHLFVPSNLGCGSIKACNHCKIAMESISPKMVSTELIKVLSFAKHT